MLIHFKVWRVLSGMVGLGKVCPDCHKLFTGFCGRGGIAYRYNNALTMEADMGLAGIMAALGGLDGVGQATGAADGGHKTPGTVDFATLNLDVVKGLPPESPSFANHGASMDGVSSPVGGGVARSKGTVELS